MTICKLCDTNNTIRKVFNKSGYEIVECYKCGLTFVRNIPGLSEILRLYDENYYKGEDSPIRDAYYNYFNEREKFVLKFKKFPYGNS